MNVDAGSSDRLHDVFELHYIVRNKIVRISKKTQQIICDTTQEVFGEKVSVSLFGSRTNDTLKGGDIDLLVQSEVVIASRQQKNCNWLRACKCAQVTSPSMLLRLTQP